MLNFKQPLRTGISLILLAFSTGSLSARIFTDKAGNTYDGSVLSTTADQVTLMDPARGKVYKIPIANLSAKDRDYIEALRNKPSSNTPKKRADAKKRQPTKPPTRKNVSGGSRFLKASELKVKYRLVDNYLTNWPQFVSIPTTVHVRVVSEDKAKRRYVYHSPSFEFISDVPLSTTIIGEFGLMFETTREYCRKLPISSMKAHVPKYQGRNQILLFEDMNTYVRNGGHPNAAGVFVPRRNVILVPLQSLGVKKLDGGYDYDHNASNSVLVHEIVHQLTDYEYFFPGARGWFSEGLAQYCAVTRYGRGDFSVRGVQRQIKDYVIGNDKYAGLGTKTRAPDLEAFMLQPYSSFTSNGAYNYRLGTLLTYYFFHMERDRKNLIAFLKALKRGETGRAALNHLLKGRSFDELERDIHNAWRAYGIEINFQ